MILIIHHYEIIWNEVKPYMHDATTTDVHSTQYCKLQLSKTTYAPWRNTNVEWKFLHRNMSETNVWEFPFLLSLGADCMACMYLLLLKYNMQEQVPTQRNVTYEHRYWYYTIFLLLMLAWSLQLQEWCR